MQFDYDKETDSLYITLLSGGSVESEEISEDIILDYNADGKVVGIDLQHASKHTDMAGIQVRGFSPALDVPPIVR
jgi:uncharacterized protein YuzE